MYIYSTKLHQDFYQKLFNCFSNYISFHIIPIILNGEDVDVVIEEIAHNNDFKKSDTEIETYESIEELIFPQEYHDGGFIILDDFTEKEMKDPRVQTMFMRSRHNNLSKFIICQDYYELPKKTIRAKGNIYHIFKSNNFLGVRNVYQDNISMDMTLNDFKY